MPTKFRIFTTTHNMILDLLYKQEKEGYELINATIDPNLSHKSKMSTFHCFFRNTSVIEVVGSKVTPFKRPFKGGN